MTLLYYIILSLLTTAIFNYFIPEKWSKRLVIMVQILVIGMVLVIFQQVRVQGEVSVVLGNYPEGIGIALRVDALSAPLLLMTNVSFLGFMVFAYQKHYMNHLFMFLFICLQALISAFFMSSDLFNLFILVEVSTLAVSVLIMYKQDGQAIYDGMIYLLVNIVSGMIFLVGIGFIYRELGTVDLTIMVEAVRHVQDSERLILPYTFLMTAICLKAAMMPLFSWLPKAHGTPSAPSIVSAILSGLYVKNGLYLFLRMNEIFKPVIDCSLFFMITGCITAIVGALFAMGQKDIKLLLAYSTISQVGLIMFAINMNSDYAYWGGVYHIVHHGMLKSVLFLCAGMIIESYNTRNIYKIRGVFQRMPLVGVATAIAILGITGAPFFNGSVSKYYMSKDAHTATLQVLFALINLGTIISFTKYSRILFKEKGITREKQQWNQIAVVLCIALGCWVSGTFSSAWIHTMFGRKGGLTALNMIAKLPTYLMYVAVGASLYFGLIKRSGIIKRLGGIEIGFNGICVSIFSFLGCLLLQLVLLF